MANVTGLTAAIKATGLVARGARQVKALYNAELRLVDDQLCRDLIIFYGGYVYVYTTLMSIPLLYVYHFLQIGHIFW